MKKILCLFIGLMVLLSSLSALAEEFTLHSGVKFGMTMDEVKEKEAEKGNEFVEETEKLTSKNSITIINYPSQIVYYFKDNVLEREQYRFDETDISTIFSEYERVYGTPDCSSISGEVLALPEESFVGPRPSSREVCEPFLVANGLGQYVSWCRFEETELETYQWIIEADNGYVVIDIYGCEYYFTIANDSKKFFCGSDCLVDYRYFDVEEIESARQANVEKYSDI